MRGLVAILVATMVFQAGFLAGAFRWVGSRAWFAGKVPPTLNINTIVLRASTSSSSSSAIVPTSQEMKEVGRTLGRNLRETPAVVFLRGDVGAGKTTLSRGIVEGWGGGSEVNSPSYLIDLTYNNDAGDVLHHVDLYRLKGDEDLTSILGEEVFRDGAVWLVEWPERLEEGTGMNVKVDGLDLVEVEIGIVEEEDGGGGVGSGGALIDFSDLDMDGEKTRHVKVMGKSKERLNEIIKDVAIF
ncbi:hypothetical protein TL16_g04800 [Triparma laevis f. inornata]|uniref:tRNA threonylcarbamoyladenosine biosynthesis protein TsaE n=2 Tax=Triparma laevis TaxID=1534972 RepID=A0A9W7FT45_9STRA|nr:hypothetical protein TL16_g04800 [Triparma laevis f. inornata]GMI17847.1 hypothetical protein TrLO_g14171 [Triparma laevis f. longispina]